MNQGELEMSAQEPQQQQSEAIEPNTEQAWHEPRCRQPEPYVGLVRASRKVDYERFSDNLDHASSI